MTEKERASGNLPRQSPLIVVLVIYEPLRQAAIAHVFFTQCRQPLPCLPTATSSSSSCCLLPPPPSRCYVCQLSTSTDVSAFAFNCPRSTNVNNRERLPLPASPCQPPLLCLHANPLYPLLLLHCLIIIEHNSFLDRVCH